MKRAVALRRYASVAVDRIVGAEVSLSNEAMVNITAEVTSKDLQVFDTRSRPSAITDPR
jgi:hypothetical protein